MDIVKLRERLNLMLRDLERAEKAGITDAEVRAIFTPDQAKQTYIDGSNKRMKSIPVHMDYFVTFPKRGTVGININERIYKN